MMMKSQISLFLGEKTKAPPPSQWAMSVSSPFHIPGFPRHPHFHHRELATCSVIFYLGDVRGGVRKSLRGRGTHQSVALWVL